VIACLTVRGASSKGLLTRSFEPPQATATALQVPRAATGCPLPRRRPEDRDLVRSGCLEAAQEGDDFGDLLVPAKARKGHLGPGDEVLRLAQERRRRRLVPGQAGRRHGLG
jgi:hypothetical protein